MTPQELEEIKARHPAEESGVDLCGQEFPCDTVRLLARIEELEKGLRAARGRLEGIKASLNLGQLSPAALGAFALCDELAALGGEE